MITFTLDEILQNESIKARIIHKAIKTMGTKAPNMEEVNPVVLYNNSQVAVMFVKKEVK